MGDGLMLTVGDIELPPGVRTNLPPDTPVVHISFVKREEEVAVGEEAEVPTESAEPEVISETKAEQTGKGEEDEASS
jgi:hypothetical protein